MHFQALTPSDGWRSPSATTFRKIFAKWDAKTIWAAHRRYMVAYYEQAKEGATFEVLQDILKLPDPNVMFLWNIYSADDDRVFLPEIFAAVAVFSGATLEEKGQYLHHLFDSRRSGMLRGEDAVLLLRGAADVFSKVLGVSYKRKAFMAAARETLPTLLPALAARVKVVGLKAAFEEELVAVADLEACVVTPFKPLYDRMPLKATEEPSPQRKGRLPVKDWPKEADAWEAGYAKKKEALAVLAIGRIQRNAHGTPKVSRPASATSASAEKRASAASDLRGEALAPLGEALRPTPVAAPSLDLPERPGTAPAPSAAPTREDKLVESALRGAEQGAPRLPAVESAVRSATERRASEKKREADFEAALEAAARAEAEKAAMATELAAARRETDEAHAALARAQEEAEAARRAKAAQDAELAELRAALAASQRAMEARTSTAV